jgi:hypothetical protein
MAQRRSASAIAAIVALVLAAAAAQARTPTPSATPVPTPEPPTALLRARVFDASQGPAFPIVAASVSYQREPSGVRGVVSTGLNGELEILISQHDDVVNVFVTADGFLPAQLTYFPDMTDVVDVALQPQAHNTTITVGVYDPSFSLPQAISGAEVQYTLFGRGGGVETGTLLTGEEGTVSFDLPIDVESVTVRVAHADYAPFLATYSGAALREQPYIPVELQRFGSVARVIGGVVYDAAQDPGEPIADAEVRWERFSDVLPHAEGVVRSGNDGQYTLTVDMTTQSWLDITAAAPGFASRTVSLGYLPLVDTIDFALAPIGGVIALTPNASLDCAGHVDVTIANTAAPGDILTIVNVVLHHGYSQGEYGTGFSWDLSAIEIPTSLDGGQSLTIPVTYLARAGDFDSRLHVDVESGARSGTASLVIHGHAGAPFGHPVDRSCGSPSPTPTHTPPPDIPCAGDCDGNRVVTVDELVRGTRIALGVVALETSGCVAMDSDADSAVSIARADRCRWPRAARMRAPRFLPREQLCERGRLGGGQQVMSSAGWEVRIAMAAPS